MLKKTVEVAGYATLISNKCVMIYSCLIEPRSCYNGPEIKSETIMFESMAVVITFDALSARALADSI
jgi:hypothetical protein